jgi:hypothetical protein
LPCSSGLVMLIATYLILRGREYRDTPLAPA